MCGIIGYIGSRPVTPILLEGLARLEYRGYDSVGIAVISPQGELAVKKVAGKLPALIGSLGVSLPEGQVGLGHTRWATHGNPTAINAHPHLDCQQRIALVHNGIVENYLELRAELAADGHRFTSQTDSEVIVHLVEAQGPRNGGILDAARRAALRLKGANTVALLSLEDPQRIVVFKTGNAGGLAIGHAGNDVLLASDLPALLPYTSMVSFLSSGEMASIGPGEVKYWSLGGAPISKRPQKILYDPVTIAKGGYKHFMLKEILEQPQAVTNAMRGRGDFASGKVYLDEFPLEKEEASRLKRIVLVGCGTSFHAAYVGRYMIEELSGLPAEVEHASEYRYRSFSPEPATLAVAVGQSGETADTLAAMEESGKRGARVVTICNVEGSQATRLAEATLYMRAGLEMGVASTKTFTTSLVTLYFLALYLGQARGHLSQGQSQRALQDLAQLPSLMGALLEGRGVYENLALRYHKRDHFLYLGRGPNYPVALEGALKLKEISYIHAEGYAAGEMKHGPIALIDENMPVVAIAPKDRLYEKMVNSIQEVKARGGIVIALTTHGNQELAEQSDDVIYLPVAPPLLTPVLAVLPLQLLAYYIAVRRGCDVDQPRNLAKSVTVE